jgi:formate dehydrogenase maturation protein FdhE
MPPIDPPRQSGQETSVMRVGLTPEDAPAIFSISCPCCRKEWIRIACPDCSQQPTLRVWGFGVDETAPWNGRS